MLCIMQEDRSCHANFIHSCFVVLQIGDVRLCCLRALYPLYETPDLCHKLEYFTNRFKVDKQINFFHGCTLN